MTSLLLLVALAQSPGTVKTEPAATNLLLSSERLPEIPPPGARIWGVMCEATDDPKVFRLSWFEQDGDCQKQRWCTVTSCAMSPEAAFDLARHGCEVPNS